MTILGAVLKRAFDSKRQFFIEENTRYAKYQTTLLPPIVSN